MNMKQMKRLKWRPQLDPMEFAFLRFSYEKSFKSKEALVRSVSSGFLVKFSQQLLSGRFLVRFSQQQMLVHVSISQLAVSISQLAVSISQLAVSNRKKIIRRKEIEEEKSNKT